MYLKILVLILVLSLCDAQRRLVHMLFRHGDRTPTHTLPSDPRGDSIWPNGLGQLTQLGIQQEYELGLFTRKRYSSYLNDTYVKDEIEVLSTDKERTLMSAYAFLAGLYPPIGTQTWGADKNYTLGQIWQPIPVRSLSYLTDPMLSTNVPCPVYDDLLNKQYNSEEAKALTTRFKSLIDYALKMAGYTDGNDLQNAFDLYGTLDILQKKNLQPDWDEPELIENLEHLKRRSYDFKFKNLHMAKIKAGTFLNTLLNNIDDYTSERMNPKKKLFLYSSHDSIIGALLYALNIWNDKLPPYGSALIFELFEIEKLVAIDNVLPRQFEVRLYYKNDTVTNAIEGMPYPMLLPGECGNKFSCPLESFKKFLAPVVLKDFDKECQKHKQSTSTLTIVLCVGAVAFVLILMGVGIWCRRKRQKPKFTYRSANFSGDDTASVFS